MFLKRPCHTRANHFRRLAVLFVALMLPCAGQLSVTASAAEKKVFMAGAATSNITGPLGGQIVGSWSPRPAEHVHDDLYAKCLVLDDGNTRLAIVLCDILGLPRDLCDAAKQAASEKTGIPVEHILVAATHTHSATNARGPNKLLGVEEFNDYQQFIISRVSDGICRAVANLEPARIGWGSADKPEQVFNRRWLMKPGTPVPNPFGGQDKARMNPGRGDPNLLEPAGPIDPEVAIVSVQSAAGRPIALLANYSLHYVGGGRPATISADYFGMFADRIQELLGADRLDPPFVGMMSNGSSGDINNINVKGESQRLPPYAKMREVADDVAQAVFRAHRKIEFHDWIPLAAAQEELTLARRKVTPEQVAYVRAILEKPDDAEQYHKHERQYATRVLMLDESSDEVDILLQAFRIGDVGISAIPFEVFVEIGLELKEKGPLGQTFTISHANGSFGYLPTVGQHALGGYETWLGTNVVEIQTAPKIVKTLLAMFERVSSRTKGQ